MSPCPGRSAALLQRCAAEPGPMLQKAIGAAWVPALRSNAKALQRVRDTRVMDDLLQCGRQRLQFRDEIGAQRKNHFDNRERDARCDQAVFDGGGAGFILRETRNQVLHELKDRKSVV